MHNSTLCSSETPSNQAFNWYKLFLPSHHLSKLCHICQAVSVISYRSKVSKEKNTKWLFSWTWAEKRAQVVAQARFRRSLAIPLFCHCQFDLLFDMHVICIMRIWSTAPIIPSFLHSFSPFFLDMS